MTLKNVCDSGYFVTGLLMFTGDFQLSEVFRYKRRFGSWLCFLPQVIDCHYTGRFVMFLSFKD